ncbi:SOUL family heme-binding protein [Halosolutus gelatinilyticus]|uniref:SOUL family heme-binding protein n=1 Tax=Halosolutus gelatinilyticus TaxID=2931975 RepID=UPI001FF55D8C|nr:heme-binding protein [Halosolutus gelatinilyticus]
MRRQIAVLAAGVCGLLAAWIGWGAYVLGTTERVPAETLDRDGPFELRRYPATVLVETTAPDRSTAFRRLFRYISGENGTGDELPMTAPVTTHGETGSVAEPVRSADRGGDAVTTTAPVGTDRSVGGITMAFFLPPTYAVDAAPIPTDPDVHLVVEPSRTVAVHRFSWYATPDRVDRARRSLFAELDDRVLEHHYDPALLQYNDPWTPPFMRRNEVAVTVER